MFNVSFTMEQLFTITRQNRKILSNYLNNTPVELLVKIPQGFNNNIWWNIAHVVVTQQKLVYGRSELPFNLSEKWITGYQKGTVPKERPAIEEQKELATLLFSTIEQTEEDYQNNRFQHYASYMTSPKVPLHSVEDAIAFNVFHEGLHLGSIMALARAVNA